MANQVTWGGTTVHNADGVTPYDDLAGSSSGTLDTEIFFQGTGSIGKFIDDSLDGLLIDAGSAQDFSGNTFYFLINCAIVGLLDTKANGGFRIRFCGATVTDWFEVYVGGSDSWPASFSGGWTAFIVDIDEARSVAVTNGWTNGTTPATTAVRYAGYAAITGGTKPRMTDNTWMDITVRLPANTAAIIVEGRDGGTSDWDWQGVVDAMETLENPIARVGDGGVIVLGGPVQFGIADSSTHAFTDTNKTVAFVDAEFIPSTLHGMSALGGAGGTTNVTFGVKTGTGDDAVGNQGGTIQAALAGARWSFDFNNANVDGVNLYGVTMIHGGDMLLDSTAVSVISSSYVDCDSALVTNSEQLRINVIEANTADGVAFMTTDDLGDIVFSNFEFSDGHGIELTTPRVATQTSKGNKFSGYGAIASNDAAIFNDTAGAVTINVTESGDTPTYRNGTSATTTVNNPIVHTVTNLRTSDRVIWIRVSDGVELENLLESSGSAAYSYNYVSDTDVYVQVLSGDNTRKNTVTEVTLGNTDASIPAVQAVDNVYFNP